MTDLEISKALALAIGWPLTWETEQGVVVYAGLGNKVKSKGKWLHGMRVFDYRDWNVISPIAVKYDAFPCLVINGVWEVMLLDGAIFTKTTREKTPQKAIAIAVINKR